VFLTEVFESSQTERSDGERSLPDGDSSVGDPGLRGAGFGRQPEGE